MVKIKTHYSQYVSDKKLIDSYNDYQKKYKSEPRESDKSSIEMIDKEMLERSQFTLLDVACSTGNFLYHLRSRFPDAHLTGVDLAKIFIDQCKDDPDLSNVQFETADLLDLSTLGKFDIITANAVTYLLDGTDYKIALDSIFSALNPAGIYIGFEFVNPFSVQDLTIIETNEWNPNGLTLRIRPMKKVQEEMERIGFSEVEFIPFDLPIDLPHPGYDADVLTYTVKDDSGSRMAFRGALYQPWCHFVARKPK